MTATAKPLWLDGRSPPAHPELTGAQQADVVVLGAGITGITTALLLAQAERDVVVLERAAVCQGVTGHTTAKVTSLHQLAYADIADRFDEDRARRYGEANQAAIAQMAAWVDQLGIDCAWQRRPAVTFTQDPTHVEAVRAEAEVAARLGLPARLATDTDLPLPVEAAVVFDAQAQLHPYDYVLGLAEEAERLGAVIYERSPAVDVREDARWHVATPSGSVEAEHVVVATHLPVLDRGLFFAKAHPQRSYALAMSADGPLPVSMAINVEQPTRSVRTYERHGRGWLIVSGEGHKPGADDDEPRHWDALAEWARAHFPVATVTHRWSAQDYTPIDAVPYVGRLSRTSSRLWTATGFRKWGMTAGTAAAIILHDLIQGRDNPWAKTFDAHRRTPIRTAASFVGENLEVARHFVGDRRGLPGREALADLAAGEGRVVRSEGEAYAVSRDDVGSLRSLSPVCPHMACHVRWNSAERSWDCPCHGSRFDADGRVLQGPALRPLDPKPIPAADDAPEEDEPGR